MTRQLSAREIEEWAACRPDPEEWERAWRRNAPTRPAYLDDGARARRRVLGLLLLTMYVWGFLSAVVLVVALG